jgi:hypothetical protein
MTAWTATWCNRSDMAIIRTFPPLGPGSIPHLDSLVNRQRGSMHRGIERGGAQRSTVSTP